MFHQACLPTVDLRPIPAYRQATGRQHTPLPDRRLAEALLKHAGSLCVHVNEYGLYNHRNIHFAEKFDEAGLVVHDKYSYRLQSAGC